MVSAINQNLSDWPVRQRRKTAKFLEKQRNNYKIMKKQDLLFSFLSSIMKPVFNILDGTMCLLVRDEFQELLSGSRSGRKIL